MVNETNLVVRDRSLPTPSVNWANTQIETPTKRSRRIRVAAPINNKIFRECADLTDDVFWRKIFIEASEGKFPSKISYLNGCLYYKRGQNVEVCQLSIDPENARKEFMAFLHHWSEIYSEVDMRQRHVESFADREGVGSDSWTSMGKRYRDQALSEFISKESKRRGLNPTQERQLSAILNIGITLRYFHNENIIVHDFSIVKIEGLMYGSIGNENGYKYYIDPLIQQKKSRPSKSKKAANKIKTYGEKWFAHHEQIQFGRQEEIILRTNEEPTTRIVERPSRINGHVSTDTDSDDLSNT